MRYFFWYFVSISVYQVRYARIKVCLPKFHCTHAQTGLSLDNVTSGLNFISLSKEAVAPQQKEKYVKSHI